MKKTVRVFSAGIVLALMAILGCEWEDSDSFNTSLGAGADINFSGVYTAKDGQYLVGTNITQLLVTQVGNTIEVWDNNNSYYTGTIGSPGVVSEPDSATGEYPAGAVMLQAQVNFSGKNELTDEDVNFIGIVRAVAVDDIRGTTTSTDQTLTSSAETNEWWNWGVGETETGLGGTETSSELVESEATSGTTSEYSIDESNTHYVLDGNWVEANSVSSVSGWTHAVSSTFSQ